MAMETLSITEAKNRFTEIADRAAAEHDHFTVTRNGHPHVMVVSVAEWDELQETIAVLTDPETRADLAESAEAAQRGDFTTEEEIQAILDARPGPGGGRGPGGPRPVGQRGARPLFEKSGPPAPAAPVS